MAENIIYNDMDESIGYYKDFVKLYKDLIKDATDKGDWEEVEYLTDQIKDIEDFREFDGLLVLSENNGMGFTCNPYKLNLPNERGAK
jgi:hypothetical protein